MKKVVCYSFVCIWLVGMFLWKLQPVPQNLSFPLEKEEWGITFLDRDHLGITIGKQHYLWDLTGNNSAPSNWEVAWSSLKDLPKAYQQKEHRLSDGKKTFCIDEIVNCDFVYLYQSQETKEYLTFFSYNEIENPSFSFSFYQLENPMTLILTRDSYRLEPITISIQNDKNSV